MIKIENLNFSYSGKEPYILNNVNLHIIRGSYVAVMGDNGSAKTTLAKLMLGLLKPAAGSVTVDAKRIGYLPQNARNVNSQFPITVIEFMKCHARAIRLRDMSEIECMLEKLGMQGHEQELLSNLSGGQLQKVLIARALLGKPELLVLDEPSTGLDSRSQDDVYALLKRINTELGVTIVSVEHNLHAARKNSTVICSIEKNTVKTNTVAGGKDVTV
ncbi:MAG: putative metal transporter, ATPase component [Firmicutes bacterium]|nr:putative metal transporter, ATPase component [Bacillota bacterium]